MQQSRREIPASWPSALSWLRDHLDGLVTAPERLHDHAIGDDGAPRLSAAFLAVLVGSPYATVTTTEQRNCRLEHPFDAPPCPRCDGQLTYSVDRDVYRHPLAAALATLRNAPATSHDWPRPYVMVVTLIREGLDLDRAAEAIDHPILGPDHRKTVEAAFLLAIRKLAGRWSSGPIPKTPKWTELSSSQQAAEDAT